MKKILVLFIIVMTLMGLCSCGESKYKPVPSTDEEARVVMTFSADGQSYQMKYELYRALFIGNKAIIDGGDDSVLLIACLLFLDFDFEGLLMLVSLQATSTQ